LPSGLAEPPEPIDLPGQFQKNCPHLQYRHPICQNLSLRFQFFRLKKGFFLALWILVERFKLSLLYSENRVKNNLRGILEEKQLCPK